MAGKVSKIRNKLSITGRNIVQDIHELVIELKRTVIDLEDIASKLQERALKETNDTGSLVSKHTTDLGEDFGIKNKSHHHRIKCDSCGKQFMKISDLEEHIKIEHEEYQTYKCDVCRKTFVTK